jgi:hypothetical protein
MEDSKMVTVASLEWQDMIDGNFPENPARPAWREAVAAVADRAKATLPECNGRVEKAVAIVLAGDVELLPDGKAKVASQSNGATKYFVVNGACECPDYPKAPQAMCKHRIAYGIYKRAKTLAGEKVKALDAAKPQVAQTPVAPQALPEAPASVHVYIELAGRKVQVTLRDADETRLLHRLEALLQRFPSEAATEPEPPEGWCSTHSVQMSRHSNAKGAWWSHKTPEGWCHGK